MLTLIFVVLFLSGNGAFANDKANKFFEKLLNTTFAEEIRNLKLDPAPMSDFSLELDHTIKIIGKVKSKADFKDGKMKGLSKAIRLGDCQGSFESESKSINCTITWQALTVKYKGNLKYGKMPNLNIKSKAKLKATHFYLNVVQDSSKKLSIQRYFCTKMGAMEVEFEGLGPMNRFMDVLEEDYTQFVHARIFNTMNERVGLAFSIAIAKMQPTF